VRGEAHIQEVDKTTEVMIALQPSAQPWETSAMPAQQTIEERLAAIERALNDLQQRLAPSPTNWVERISGSMKEFPEFEQVLEFGRQFRHADRPSEEAT